MDDFETIMGRAKRKRTDKDVVFSNKDSQLAYNLIRKYFSENKDATVEGCVEYLLELFSNINLKVMRLPSIKSDLIRYLTAERLLEKDHERRDAYERVIKKENEGHALSEGEVIRYSGNKIEAEDLLVTQSLIGLRASQKDNESMRDAIVNYSRRTPKERRQITATFDKSSKENLAILVDLFADDEFEQFSRFLKSYIPIFRNTIRDSSITFLQNMMELLRKFGTIEEYENQQKRIFGLLGLDGVTEIFGEHPVDDELFTTEELRKIDIYRILMLNAFWVNRLSKEIENFNTSFFIINQLGLWDKILEATPDPKTGEISIDVPEEDIAKIYRKVYFLRGLTDQIYLNEDELPYRYVTEDVPTEGDQKDGNVKVKPKKYKSIDINMLDKMIRSNYSEQYEEYFGNLIPERTHDLLLDFEDYRIMDNAKKNAYLLKDNMMIAVLAILTTKNPIRNWGAVEGSTTGKLLVLAGDLQGLNLPVRLHIDKNMVRDFLQAYKGDTKIPIYDGNEDFRVFGRQISTQFLIPVGPDKAEKIKELSKAFEEGGDRRNLLEHVAFICGDEAYPEHLRVKPNKKKKSKKKPATRYIDLKDGIIYTRGYNGEYQEETKKREGRSISDE